MNATIKKAVSVSKTKSKAQAKKPTINSTMISLRLDTVILKRVNMYARLHKMTRTGVVELALTRYVSAQDTLRERMREKEGKK